MTTKAELRSRIISARRSHDAAIRVLDRQWSELLARLGETPRADHPAVIEAAARDMAPLLAFTLETGP